MKVHLAMSSGFSVESGPIPVWREMEKADKIKEHRIVDDPAEADIILFPDLHLHRDFELRGLRKHFLWKEYAHKILVYDERDIPTLTMKGLFVSLPKRNLDIKKHRACAYYTIKAPEAEILAQKPDLLFGFVGSNSHPIREQVFKLNHPRAIVEEAKNFVFFDSSVQGGQRQKFADIMSRAKFSLCPRGHGASSIRLFETMASGRVPVIISDDWTPLEEIANANCAIIVPEKDIAQIPQLLEAAEPDFENMSRSAKEVFDKFFSREVHFHNLIEKCVSLVTENSTEPETLFPVEYYQLKFSFWRNELRIKGGGVKRKLMRRG
jgi:hypothetical protein